MIVFVVPTIPSRVDMLKRARASIAAQSKPVDFTVEMLDTDRLGAAAMRNRGVEAALLMKEGPLPERDWIGFLDDDDELLPHHVELLTSKADEAGVGVAWGWYEVVGGSDPLPDDFRGRTFEPDAPHCTPITYMVRREVLADVWASGTRFVEDMAHTGYWSQDMYVLVEAVRRGGHIALPDTTWHWHHHRGNTSGKPW